MERKEQLQTVMIACPVCKNLTLSARALYDICPVCFWEDDGYDDSNADDASGCNGLSINQARENFQKFGAVEQRFSHLTRKPEPDESFHEERNRTDE